MENMGEKEILEKLERKGVKPTANRILVLKALLSNSTPVSLSDLEDFIVTMDKSSIFRVLTLFLEHNVVHAMEDGSGSLKYEVCMSEGRCSLSDMHIHFYCEECHRTYCFKTIHVPVMELPENFTPHFVNYMIKGECPECKRRHSEI